MSRAVQRWPCARRNTMSHHTVVVCRLAGRRLHRGSGELFCNCMTRRRIRPCCAPDTRSTPVRAASSSVRSCPAGSGHNCPRCGTGKGSGCCCGRCTAGCARASAGRAQRRRGRPVRARAPLPIPGVGDTRGRERERNPGPTGSSADLPWGAAPLRVRVPEAIPVSAGFFTMPRTLAPFPRGLPVGVGMPGNASASAAHGETVDGGAWCELPDAQLLDDRGRGRVEAQAGGITGRVGSELGAKRRAAAGEQVACAQGREA
jgi:hypothetical protein